jgi:hypothetical protein
MPTQGYGRFAASALGFAAPRLQRFIRLHLMRMLVPGLKSSSIVGPGSG